MRLRGLLGVSVEIESQSCGVRSRHDEQRNILYISDPLALQQVLAHEGGDFGLSEVIHTYVPLSESFSSMSLSLRCRWGDVALGQGLAAVRGKTLIMSA